MIDRRHRQPASDKAPHAIPKDAAILAAPRQRAMPESPHLEPKNPQRVLIQRHTVIADVSTHHRLQPPAYFRDGFVRPSLKFGFHLVQLRLQPLADGLPQHREPSIAPLLHADVREAKKIERFRFPFSAPPPLVDGMRTKFQQPRLLGMQFQEPRKNIPPGRRRSCEQLRMTRGRCGSLHHIRMTFAFTTPRRFNRRTRGKTCEACLVCWLSQSSPC
jgi:hypothetical protein